MRESARFVLPTLTKPYGMEHSGPGFELTFVCSGSTYKAFVRARNVQAASEEAVIELASQEPGFEPSRARLISVIQTL